ncbi:MAG TPA: hypothetical protein VF904_06920 [Anaeromyxobacteraceae bacterium]
MPSDAAPTPWRPIAARLALVAAVFLALVVVRQLYTAGAALLALKRPAIYLPAALGAVMLAMSAALIGWRRAPVAAAALALAVFLANDRVLASGDTHGAALLPYNIIRHGSLSLDGLVASPVPYWVVERDGRLWSRYPVAAAVLAAPIYLPAALGDGRAGALPQTEKLAAAILAAISVGFVLAALLRLGAPRWLALTATALYALGSPVLTTASQALWQHGPGVLALSAALWGALRARDDPRFDAVTGAFCGVAVVARPTNALVAAAVLASIALRGPRPLGRALISAAGPLALLGAYQASVFGSPFATGYGTEVSAFTTPLGEGLRALIFSPTRGLLAFVPWAVLSAAGLARGARRDPLLAMLGVSVVATILLYAKWHAWWGGWCYGPRLLADLSPVLALALGSLADAPRRLLTPALVLTGMLAIGVNGLGTFASRSQAARAVYDVRDEAQAMEAWRWPPAGLASAGLQAMSGGARDR